MIEARKFQGQLYVKSDKQGLYGYLIQNLGGTYVKKWDCVKAHWTSMNCAKLINTIHKFRLEVERPELFAEVAHCAWPVIKKQPGLFPDIMAMPNEECLYDHEPILRGIENGMLKKALWRHQRAAFAELHRLTGAILDMGMGTGKSLTAIAMLFSDKHDNGLIVCPKSVMDIWPLEFEKHCKADIRLYAGNGKKRQSIAKFIDGAKKEMELAKHYKQPFVLIVNYEKIWQGAFPEFLLKQDLDYLVFDEVHRLKSRKGVTSEFAKKLRPRAARIIGCSGTLLPHSPIDAFAIFRAVDPAVFGENFGIFSARYAEKGGFEGKQVIGFKNQEDMHQRISAISYRITTEEAVDLPPCQHIERFCEFEPETRKAYLEMAREMYFEFKGRVISAANALVKSVRLMQLTSGIVKDTEGQLVRIGNEKLELLKDILEDIDKNEPLVVFCNFTADIEAVRAALEADGRSTMELSGKVNEYLKWKAGEALCLVVQTKSGREGLDFTRARLCFYYSIGRALSDYDQSLRRIHRPGQLQDVIYYHLLVKGSIDKKVYEGLAARRKMVVSVLEGIFEEFGDKLEDWQLAEINKKVKQ